MCIHNHLIRDESNHIYNSNDGNVTLCMCEKDISCLQVLTKCLQVEVQHHDIPTGKGSSSPTQDVIKQQGTTTTRCNFSLQPLVAKSASSKGEALCTSGYEIFAHNSRDYIEFKRVRIQGITRHQYLKLQ
jgi:hypothetical protein